MMLASIAREPSCIRMPLTGEDPMSTLGCLVELGVKFEWKGDQELWITPPERWRPPVKPLECGNSGTTVRLIAGLLATHSFESRLLGDSSLSKRPMGRIAEPLQTMGATVVGTTLPMTISGHAPLRAIDFVNVTGSAQVKSCVLLAGLGADGKTSVTENAISRDHTERMLEALEVSVERGLVEDGTYRAAVEPPKSLPGFTFTVPADISSAAFMMVAAAIIPGAKLELEGVGVNPTRTGIIDVFDQAGLYYEVIGRETQLNEAVANINIPHIGHEAFDPFSIKGSLVPRLIDEIPVLAVMATQLNGTSIVRDAKELRIKETDRIAKVAEGLVAMGASVETFEDGMAITGPTKLKGTQIDAAGDHRIGMAFAIAGLVAEGETVIDGAETIATSYPAFESDLRRLCGV
jgi:3-phosphoshikimate 1-carboxyvinyltransferase